MRFLSLGPRLRPCVLAGLLAAGHACAHPLLQDSLWLQVESDQVRVAVNVSAREIAVAQGILLPEQITGSAEYPASALEKHGDYLRTHLHLLGDHQELIGLITHCSPPLVWESPENTFYQYELSYRLANGVPSSLTLQHAMLCEWSYAPGTPWEVTYAVRCKRWDSPLVRTGLLTRDSPLILPTGLGEPESHGGSESARFNQLWTITGAYIWLGIHHTFTGYDHLLFVAALVLGTVGVWEMVRAIACFSLAHTLTLALSFFGLVRLPPSIVEPLIALSILAVALENIIWKDRTHSRMLLGSAFGFGLVHGLGFASGLVTSMADLPLAFAWLALISFSVGVELAHQIFVIPLFMILRLVRSCASASTCNHILRGGSALIAACGLYYLFLALTSS